MADRIMGSETEWAMLLTENGKPNPLLIFDPVAEHCHILFNSIPSPPRLASSAQAERQFYGNGAKIYMDTGNHLEYATGEVKGAKELVQHEKAGERIIECAIQTVNQHQYFKKRDWQLHSYKNNNDIAGNTFGSHENYCMIRKKFPGCCMSAALFPLLGPHLITRQLHGGNGWLEEKNGRLKYRLSQRAKEIKESVNSATTTARAIINTRDEPHADEERYFRLHLICGDALMAQTALFLKFGTTSLVLDMIEDGFLTGKPFGDGNDFLSALHDFSEDSTLRVAPNIGGKTYTIINLQEEYFNLASRFCEICGCTPEQQCVLDLWKKIITLAKTPEPHLALAPFVDWAAKKMLMEHKMKKLGHNWSTASTTVLQEKIVSRAAEEDEAILLPEQIAVQETKNPPALFYLLKSMDFQFHENSPKGLARILEKRGFLERIVSDKEITRAMTHPSDNTRALPRTLWNKKLLAEGKNPSHINVDWKQVSCGRNPVFRCPDPYDTDPRFHNNY